MVTKIYCDICKKEIPEYGMITELKLTPNAMGKEISTREEICKSCAKDIKDFINKIRIKW